MNIFSDENAHSRGSSPAVRFAQVKKGGRDPRSRRNDMEQNVPPDCFLAKNN